MLFLKTRKRKRLSPLHTAIASLFFPGLGQYFNKQPVKMILFMIAPAAGIAIIFNLGVIFDNEGKFTTNLRWVTTGFVFAIFIISTIDAYRVAAKQRKGSKSDP